jgi:tetratricopeptide (TPR) repeat protein
MKRSVLLLTFILLASLTYAQKRNVTSAESLKEAGKLEEALETIELTVDPNQNKSDKTLPWPKTWLVRGSIFHAIYKSKDENHKKLSDDPLYEALKSYKKVEELDEKGRFENELKISLTFLQPDLTDQAINAFNNQDYDKALQSFEHLLELGEISVIKQDNPGAKDTVIMFNAGLAAYNAEKYDKAIQYYRDVAELGYNEGRTYILISAAYKMNKDTASALEALQEGFEKYPDDNDILTEMISIYLQNDQKDEAMRYLNLAIEKDPSEPQFYFARGSLYDALDEDEKTIENYKKAIELDDEYFNAHFNMGAFYYNKGVEQYEKAIAIPANENERYEEELAKCDQWWDLALPHMKKCHEIKSDDRSTIETLKNLYYRMIPRDEDKYQPLYQEMDSLLKNQ